MYITPTTLTKLNIKALKWEAEGLRDTNDDGVIDTETITSSFIGYAPYHNPKMSIIVTSPNSSHLNSNYDYADFGTKTEFWVPGGDEYATWERLWM